MKEERREAYLFSLCIFLSFCHFPFSLSFCFCFIFQILLYFILFLLLIMRRFGAAAAHSSLKTYDSIFGPISSLRLMIVERKRKKKKNPFLLPIYQALHFYTNTNLFLSLCPKKKSKKNNNWSLGPRHPRKTIISNNSSSTKTSV